MYYSEKFEFVLRKYTNLLIIEHNDSFSIKLEMNTTLHGVLNNKCKIVVLVVDDEDIIRKSVCRLLNKYFKDSNIELVTIEANDGIEAILAVYLATKKNVTITCIICDETMNFINGSFFSVILEKLVTLKLVKNINMYISTAYGNTIEKSKFSSLVKKIYSKPLNLKMIKEMCSDLGII